MPQRRETDRLCSTGVGDRRPRPASSPHGWAGPCTRLRCGSGVELTHGARSGEVTTDSAVLWGRASGAGRMAVRLASNGRLLRTLRGPWADERTDHTARLAADGARARPVGTTPTISFTSADGVAGQTERVSFTHRAHPRGGHLAACGRATPAGRAAGSTRSSAG